MMQTNDNSVKLRQAICCCISGFYWQKFSLAEIRGRNDFENKSDANRKEFVLSVAY
jgi:hypothetical protein